MSDITHDGADARGRDRRGELWEYRALVAATYPLFLAIAVIERTRPAPAGRPPRRSVFAEASATAKASLSCAFMG